MSSPTRPEQSIGVLVIDGPVAAADVPRLCARLLALLDSTEADVVVDVRTLAANAVTIDVLARLQLTARRLGRRISLCRSSPDLDRLVSFVGLAAVLPGRAERTPGVSRRSLRIRRAIIEVVPIDEDLRDALGQGDHLERPFGTTRGDAANIVRSNVTPGRP